MKTTRPVFIVGSPRSGTTLLQAMLMRIDGLGFPPETQFLGNSMRRRNEFGDVGSDAGFDRTVRACLDALKRNDHALDLDDLEAELRAGARDYGAMFDTILDAALSAGGWRRVGEKTPNHLLHVDWLMQTFPDAQVITIVRDGRDVAVSQREAFAEPLLSAAVRWRLYQRRHRAYADRHPAERYTSVRYEDLVSDPQRELRRLCLFLEERFDECMLEHHRREDTGFAAREAHKSRTLEPVTTSRVARYRERMTRREIALFQLVAGRELMRHGYETENVPGAIGLPGAIAELPRVVFRRLRFFASQKKKYS